MSTLIRPEISKKNDNWISKHRYYELKHFCLQYPEWKRKLQEANYIRSSSVVKLDGKVQIEYVDKVGDEAVRLEKYKRKVNMVEEACNMADPELQLYLLKALTEGVTFEYLKMVMKMPCGRSSFYKAYRKAFWILDKIKVV